MTGAHVDDRTAVLEARNVSLDFDGTDSSGSKVTIHALDRVNLTTVSYTHLRAHET